jgi:quinol monooxygenase YgiN
MLPPSPDDQRMKYTLSRFTVKPEKIRETKRALAELVSGIRTHEPKTLYVVFRAESQDTFLLLMSFESEAAERLHAQSRHVARFARKLLPLCEGKPLFSELDLFVSSRKHWILEAVQAASRPVVTSPSQVHRRFTTRARRLQGKVQSDTRVNP